MRCPRRGTDGSNPSPSSGESRSEPGRSDAPLRAAPTRHPCGAAADAQLLKKQGFVPKLLVTDKLRSYASAFRRLRLTCRHEQGLLSGGASAFNRKWGEVTAMAVNGKTPRHPRGSPLPQTATMRLSVTRVVSDFSTREESPPPAPPLPRFTRGAPLPPPKLGLVKKEREFRIRAAIGAQAVHQGTEFIADDVRTGQRPR